MLTMYARAQHKDGGFALWQRMVGSSVTIDVFTERLLADLFGDHPQMAATMLKEARQRRLQQSVSALGGLSQGLDREGVKPSAVQSGYLLMAGSMLGKSRQWCTSGPAEAYA